MMTMSELQIRGGVEDNFIDFFFISQQKHMLWPSLEPS